MRRSVASLAAVGADTGCCRYVGRNGSNVRRAADMCELSGFVFGEAIVEFAYGVPPPSCSRRPVDTSGAIASKNA